MSFLRRLLGLSDPTPRSDSDRGEGRGEVRLGVPRAEPEPETEAPAAEPAGLACPYCAYVIDPPPARNRRCPACRQEIIVRRVDGRVTLLTSAAVPIFEAERQRTVDEQAWTEARRSWLRLARKINATPARRERLENLPISASVVAQSKAFYVAAAERAVKTARRTRRWGDVAQIRREQARALHEEAGKPVPPPEPIEELYRDGMTAALRALEPLSREAELVSSECCAICRADDGNIYRIATELRSPRLPHAGCPEGLCGCDWWAALTESPKRQRRTKRATGTPPAG